LLKLKDVGKLKTVISFDPLDEEALLLVKNHDLQLLDFCEIIKEGNLLEHINNNEI
jgi:hypothetical protein